MEEREMAETKSAPDYFVRATATKILGH